jgi:hypothetical protein
MLTVCFLFVMAGMANAGTRDSEEYLVTIKSYLITGSAGERQLMLQNTSNLTMTVLEEAISDVEVLYEKLQGLYAFTDYQVVDISSARIRLSGSPKTLVGGVRYQRAEQTGPWRVEFDDFGWDSEGRLQMLVKVAKDGESFITSHVSVFPERSVILGRALDDGRADAAFIAIVPIVDVVSLQPDEVELAQKQNTLTAPLSKMAGLPPIEVEEVVNRYPCPGGTAPAVDEFVAVSVMPELIKQVTPEYPERLQRDGIEGDVWIKSLIDKDGAVRECCVIRTSLVCTASAENAVFISTRWN